MRASFNRRTATRVKDGQVQKKNRHRPTVLERCVIDRQSPGRGFRHVASKRDVQAFIEIIPEWPRLSERLERIVLAANSAGDGHYRFYRREETGGIFLHAWPEDLWMDIDVRYFETHRTVFERLGLSYDPPEGDCVMCRFTEAQARAFMLLHVFMHELGHHYDRTHQKHHGSNKGEDYAERFATSRFDHLFPAYVRVFGDPAR
jgi:hypothetical protein